MSRFLLNASTSIAYLSWIGFSFLGMAPSQAMPVDAQPEVVAQSTNPGSRWPGNRAGGGTRGCEIIPGTPEGLSLLKRNFIALTPATNLGITTSAYPRLAWYIPPSSVRYAELELMSEQDMLLYRATFRIDGEEGGIYSLEIPSDASIPPLEADQAYRWTLALYCQSNDQTLDPAFNFGLDLGRTSISSYVYRQPASDQSTTNQVSWVEQVQADLQDNLWLDAMDTLLRQYCETSEQNQFAQEWQQALGTIGLSELADEPIHLQCVK
ncbi:MAG: DUF928 domain-containing protein [Prochlorotrichaceae cyanobacterium]|jgi:hypothetical protein